MSDNKLGIEDILEAVGAESSLQTALERAAEYTARLLGAEAGAVALVKEDDATLESGVYGPQGAALVGQDGSAPGLGNNLREVLTWRGERLGEIAIQRQDSQPPFSEQEQAELRRVALALAPALGLARQAETLQQAVQARDDFISVASHDLRNPLSSMRGFTQLITRLMDKSGPDKPLPLDRVQNYLVRIVRQTDNLNEMIEKILDFSRILSRRMELNNETVDFGDVAGAVVQRYQDWLEDQEKDFEPDKRHNLELEAPGQKILLEIDQSRLAQIISSLIQNAIKYSPDGGRVLVSIRPQPGKVSLSVQDEGTGIPPEKQDGVFQRWKVAGGSREAGLGVSLFIARTVVQRYGGQLVFDTTPGKGTVFTMTLPV